MAGISLPGLASGLNSPDLIASMMALEAGPQTILKNKLSTTQSNITDYQAINKKIADLITAAKSFAKPENIHAFTSSSSDASVTVKASGSAQAASLDITVTQTAATHTIVSGAMKDWPDTPATLTFVSSDGTKTEVTANSNSIDDVVRAVNNSTAGVKATKIASGVDGSGNPLYRIQFGAADAGEDGAFNVFQGSAADVTAGTATNVLASASSSVVAQGRDAKLVMYAGTAAEQEVTSSSNTFSGLLPGVDITVTKASSNPVTVTVGEDTAGGAAKAKAFTDSISAILGSIKAKQLTTTTTDSSGNTTVKGGPFTGDATIRDITRLIQEAVSGPVNGISPSEIGISFDKTGSLIFDAEKFASVLKDNPAKVDTIFGEIATRAAAAATTASDKYDGILTKKITGQQAVVTDLGKQIEGWDTRLAMRQATLEKSFSALEVAMSKLNSTSSYLSSQIANLPTYNNKD